MTMVPTPASALFFYLEPTATLMQWQAAGDRMRAVYTKDAAKVQAAEIGAKNVHLGLAKVVSYGYRKTYCIGLDYPFSMGRGMIAHRAMARVRNSKRRYHIEKALHIRRMLCRFGLSDILMDG